MKGLKILPGFSSPARVNCPIVPKVIITMWCILIIITIQVFDYSRKCKIFWVDPKITFLFMYRKDAYFTFPFVKVFTSWDPNIFVKSFDKYVQIIAYIKLYVLIRITHVVKCKNQF